MLVFVFARNCEIIMFREEIFPSNNLIINEVQSHNNFTDQYIKLTNVERDFFPWFHEYLLFTNELLCKMKVMF